MANWKMNKSLLDLVNQLNTQRWQRERELAKSLIAVYEQARQSVFEQFILMNSDVDKIELMRIEALMSGIQQKIGYYIDLSATERQRAIDDAFIMGQDLSAKMLAAGGVDIGLIGSMGMVNKGMIEALIGNVPQLAGSVKQTILFRIRDEMTKGAVIGESIPKIATRIAGSGLTQEGLRRPFPSIMHRATTIARTEIIKASDVGYEDVATKAQSFLDEEIYDCWITAHDARVEPECRAIEEGRDSRFNSIPGYPGVYRRGQGPLPVLHTHPNCRCRRIPFLVSWAVNNWLNLAALRKAA